MSERVGFFAKLDADERVRADQLPDLLRYMDAPESGSARRSARGGCASINIRRVRVGTTNGGDHVLDTPSPLPPGIRIEELTVPPR